MESDRYIGRQQEALYQLFLSLARIPAPTGKEELRAAFCLDWLKKQGAEGAYLDPAGNVVYPYHAEDGRPLLVFMAHMDVVFPDTAELPLYEKDGKIYCPGAGDNTANLAVLLMTANYVIQQKPDTGRYGLLFVCDVGEEGLGNLKGCREICAEFGSRIEAFYAFDLTMESYTAKAVGSLRYQVRITAKGGHSYQCFGNTNANAVLAGLVHRLYQVKVPEHGKTTYNVGTISGGTSVNTIAQSAEFLYEIRSDDEKDLKEMEQVFREIIDSYREMAPADCKIEVSRIGMRPCEGEVDERKRMSLFANVEKSVESVLGRKPVPVPCSTDCNIPLSLGIPSVCAGMCRGAGAHTREEYIEKDSLADGLEIAVRLLRHYCIQS